MTVDPTEWPYDFRKLREHLATRSIAQLAVILKTLRTPECLAGFFYGGKTAVPVEEVMAEFVRRAAPVSVTERKEL